MKKKNALLLFLAVVMLSPSGICQKQCSVTLHFPSQLVAKINVWSDDGKDQRATALANDAATLKGTLYSRYVSVNVFYPDAGRPGYFFGNNFWVGGGGRKARSRIGSTA